MQRKITTALIIDNYQLNKWQKSSLLEVHDLIDVKLVLNCNNTKSTKKISKHLIYYFLNIFTLKNSFTRNIKYRNTNAIWINFKSIINGNWQTIPSEIIKKVHSEEIKLIIKFGMGLIDIKKTNCDAPILSYHHGDPSKYRGRPPSFYEIFYKEHNVGTIIQKLNNKIDGGEILAISYSKIHHHSYKKTILNLFNNSKYLLRTAITNFIDKKSLAISKGGKLYKLPNNFLTLKFIFILFFRKIYRYYYGIFIEKKWNIIIFDVNKIGGNKIFKNLDNSTQLYSKYGKSPKIIYPFTFYADPFFSSNGRNIYAEALNKKNGLGEIVKFSVNDLRLKNIILKDSGHFAYPQCLNYLNDEWLLPEMSAHSNQKIYNLNDKKIINLEIEGGFLPIDATIFEFKSNFYLFCGNIDNSLDNLFLFISDKLVGPYSKHPCSPIVSNPLNARMAGNILIHQDKMYRFGQDNCFGYGKKIIVSEILEISKYFYKEEIVGDILFLDKDGTHTINFYNSDIIMDYYEEKFSFLAGYRRILGLISSYYLKK